MQFVLRAASLLILAILTGGTIAWAAAIARLASGQSLIAWSPRRTVPWGVVDLLLILAIYLTVVVAAGLVLNQLKVLPVDGDKTAITLADKSVVIWAQIAASCLQLALILSLVAFRSRATASDLGWSPATALADLKLGVIAFAMLAPPVYAIQGVLVYFWQPSKHPLMEMFKTSPDAGFFLVLFLAAAVVAPIAEEILFRVVLQGFLEKLFSFRGLDASGGLLVPVGPAVDVPTLVQPAGIAWLDANPYAPPAIAAAASIEVDSAPAQQPELRGGAAFLPIAVSSVIFALLHYSHGPDWVALTLLAAGMGYLYQRTHRLLPSLTVHALLNSLSMLGLWIQVYAMPEQKL